MLDVSDISAKITTRNDSALSPKHAAPPHAASVDAGEQRPEHAREVELDRVERDRVRQILLLDERRDQRLIRRAAERLPEAGDERQQQDVLDADAR